MLLLFSVLCLLTILLPLGLGSTETNELIGNPIAPSSPNSTKCVPGLDQTKYAERLVQALQPPNELTLPSRLVGSVLLSDGQISQMTQMKLQQRPVRQICANDTLAALQLQSIIPSAVIEYSWSFGEDCEGTAQVSPQSLHMDFNLEKNSLEQQTRLLSAFTTALLDTQFSVQVQRCERSVNRQMISQQVALICKKVALRDVDSSLQQLMRSKLILFIRQSQFSLCLSADEIENESLSSSFPPPPSSMIITSIDASNR